MKKTGTIDAYLASLGPDQRAALERLRRSIRTAAPGAEEGFSYGVPAFRFRGKPIAGFAAARGHCAYFPMSGKVVAAHARDLARYDTSKGTIRFPPGSVLPAALVRKLVKARVAEAFPAPREAPKAATVAAYLAGLPKDRRSAIEAVRKVVRRHLPAGYRESVGWGMITYEVPLRRFPDTYNGKPLPYVCLAAQKHYCALYLMAVYQAKAQAARLRAAFAAAGKRLDMGKSCIRFLSADDLPLGEIGALVAATPVEAFVAQHEASRRRGRARR
jgi:uncharacterized protein YdhG (YjbR/CyaY superfamily)